jgi:hypothetical protein
MKIILFVEGYTEKKAVPQFLKRWLDPKTNQRVGIDVVRFEGCLELKKDSPKKAKMYLEKTDVLAVIALLDLYGSCDFPPSKHSVSERYDWAKRELESKVNNPKFFQFFAVHEVEAWLLSNPDIFPSQIKSSINKAPRPEEVDFDEPPSKLLNHIYKIKTGRNYKKVTQGQQLFKKLDPDTAYDKCPYLKQLLDKMLEISDTN